MVCRSYWYLQQRLEPLRVSLRAGLLRVRLSLIPLRGTSPFISLTPSPLCGCALALAGASCARALVGVSPLRACTALSLKVGRVLVGAVGALQPDRPGQSIAGAFGGFGRGSFSLPGGNRGRSERMGHGAAGAVARLGGGCWCGGVGAGQGSRFVEKGFQKRIKTSPKDLKTETLLL